MTSRTPDFEGLDDPEPLVSAPAGARREKRPEGTGRSSKIHLAAGRPLLRDHQWIDSTTPCIDCTKHGRVDATHQFHARAERLPDGKTWIGPEGAHVMGLIADGFVHGYPQVREHDEAQRLIDLMRGIEPEPVCRNCRKSIPRDEAGDLATTCAECGIRNGLPELAARSLTDMQEMWERDLAGGEVGIKQREKEALREETARLAEGLSAGLQPLTDAIKELLAGKSNEGSKPDK
jgi:hypothetical protein